MIMIKYFIWVLSAIFPLAGLAGNVERIPSILNQLGAVERTKSGEAALALLDTIQASEIWSFGGGMGPTSSSTLVIMVLETSRPFLGWTTDQASQIGPGRMTPLMDWLRADRGSTLVMVSMLNEREPLARWIATQKIKEARSFAPEILVALRDTAQTDDWLCIRREPVANSNGAKKAMALEDQNIFDAPLRQEAKRILAMAGEELPYMDTRQLAYEGLAWMGKLYLTKTGIDRFAMEGALRQLAPLTPEIREAQAQAEIRQPPDAFLTLFRSLAELRGTVTPLSSSAPAQSKPNAAKANATDSSEFTSGNPSGSGQEVASNAIENRGSGFLIFSAVIALLILAGVVLRYIWSRKN